MPADRLGIPLQDVSDQDDERVVFSEYHGHGTRAGSFMVRQGSWKLIHHFAAEDQLFDLQSDPHELSNVASSEPERMYALMSVLRGICDPNQVQDAAEAAWHKQLQLNASIP